MPPAFDLRAAWLRCVSATEFSESITREQLPKGDNPTINRFFLVSGGMYSAAAEYVTDAEFFLHAKSDLLAAIERIHELERRLTADAVLADLDADRQNNGEPRIHTWVCGCGTVNGVNLATCRVCGRREGQV